MNKPCKLSKIKGGEAVRTDEVLGVFENVPTIGERFTMAAESLTLGGFARLVSTSPVVDLRIYEDGLHVHTENSVYLFTDLSHIARDPDNLAKAFVDTMKGLDDESGLTWDDFFDANGIPKDARSDFAVAAILKQAKDNFGFGKDKS